MGIVCDCVQISVAFQLRYQTFNDIWIVICSFGMTGCLSRFLANHRLTFFKVAPSTLFCWTIKSHTFVGLFVYFAQKLC